MKSQDVVILLKLVSLEDDEQDFRQRAIRSEWSLEQDPYSVRGLEQSLGIGKSEISNSIQRSIESGIAIKSWKNNRPRPDRKKLREFIIHGLKFVFPAKTGAMQRGIPTAFSSPVLKNYLYSGGSLISVWPYADGHDMGQSVEPLYKSVPKAVEKDKRLYAYLALIDAIRLGNQRETNLANELLTEILG